MQVLSYAGKEPTVIKAELQKAMLDLMLRQVEVLRQMTQTVVLIPEGTRLRDQTPETEK